MRWDAAASESANARRLLPDAARAWFERGAAAADPAARPKTLHAFRLATKRFRYTLELFRPVYGPGLEWRLAALRDLQRRLGDVNDCDMAQSLVASVLPAGHPERTQAEAFLKDCAHRRAARFRRCWKQVFARAGEAERWARYLGRAGSVAR